jgi:oligopeptide/dipeptide ABC transporter ATP-binding protein
MPYTRALLNALPQAGKTRLEAIGGYPPDFSNLPRGCAFSPRCPLRFSKCEEEPALLPVSDVQASACWRAAEVHDMPLGKTLVQEEMENPLV